MIVLGAAVAAAALAVLACGAGIGLVLQLGTLRRGGVPSTRLSPLSLVGTPLRRKLRTASQRLRLGWPLPRCARDPLLLALRLSEVEAPNVPLLLMRPPTKSLEGELLHERRSCYQLCALHAAAARRPPVSSRWSEVRLWPLAFYVHDAQVYAACDLEGEYNAGLAVVAHGKTSLRTSMHVAQKALCCTARSAFGYESLLAVNHYILVA